MKTLLRVCMASLLLSGSLSASALDLSIAAGDSDDGGQVLRLGVQQDFGQRWLDGRVGGYWDAGWSWWREDQGGSNHSLSLAPVLYWEFAGGAWRPYVEAGIGLALFKDTRLDGNRLGSSLQFEDRFGVGLRFGQHDIGLRATHYSNAGLASPNEGAESWMLYYRSDL